MNAGVKIRKIRELKNLTQEHLASELGISQEYYSRLESGQVKLSLDRLQQIAAAMDIDP